MEAQVHPELKDERVLALLSPAALANFELFKRELPAVLPGVQLVTPRDLNHLHELVKRSVDSHRLVLAVGGDGTLHQCLRELDLERQALGILPSGSGNDFASALGFPRGLRQAIPFLRQLRLQPTDCGTANGTRYINSAGFGIDTETLLLRQRTGRLWQKQYNLLFVRALVGMNPRPVQLSWRGGSDSQETTGSEEASFFWILGMNSPVIGGGTRIAPRSRYDDGLLDMVCIRRVPKFVLLRRMPDAIAGRHLDVERLTLFRQVKGFSVESAEPIPWLALDGELQLCAQKRVEFAVLPRALNFLR